MSSVIRSGSTGTFFLFARRPMTRYLILAISDAKTSWQTALVTAQNCTMLKIISEIILSINNTISLEKIYQ